MKKRFLNILFWSIVSAAFIGPGTVTVAASAGVRYDYTLLWALVFSIIACLVLQEASARLAAVTGHNLGRVARRYLEGYALGRVVHAIIVGTIVLGCAAYEAGNVLGAVAGASLVLDLPAVWLTLAVGLGVGLLLWFGSTRLIAQAVGLVVGLMGICFLTTAVMVDPAPASILKGSLVPRFPAGSGLLILALIGTTVVPYNIFLGSGLPHKQSLREMRISLAIAIVLGGVVSIGVLIVGAAIGGTFSFEVLAQQLASQLGTWAYSFFGLGLFAAGFSSALTASLAAAITASSLAAEGDARWQPGGSRYRAVWGAVLATGIGFGLAEVQPVPAIIAAQALNGIILPAVAVLLLLMVNDVRVLSAATVNSHALNVLTGLVTFVTIVLGLTSLARASARVLPIALPSERALFLAALVIAAVLAWPVARQIRRGTDKK